MPFMWQIKQLTSRFTPGENFALLLFFVIPILAILYTLLLRRWSALKHIAILSAVPSLFSLTVIFFDIELPYHYPLSGGNYMFGSPSQGSAKALIAACVVAIFFLSLY